MLHSRIYLNNILPGWNRESGLENFWKSNSFLDVSEHHAKNCFKDLIVDSVSINGRLIMTSTAWIS
jgi:hypothetical protein